jgi:hypothetical protein
LVQPLHAGKSVIVARPPSLIDLKSVATASGLLTLTGCSLQGAPSFPLVGAYFPAWMMCALIGILTAIGFRVAFLALGIDAILRFRLFTYVSLGVLMALLVWALVFGP